MSDRLADRLALVIAKHGPLPCSELALKVGVRGVDVAAALERNPIFIKSGNGRGTRWALTRPSSGDRRDEVRDDLGREDARGLRPWVTHDEFELLAARVTALERERMERDP
jgi:hypothetical protein